MNWISTKFFGTFRRIPPNELDEIERQKHKNDMRSMICKRLYYCQAIDTEAVDYYVMNFADVEDLDFVSVLLFHCVQHISHKIVDKIYKIIHEIFEKEDDRDQLDKALKLYLHVSIRERRSFIKPLHILPKYRISKDHQVAEELLKDHNKFCLAALNVKPNVGLVENYIGRYRYQIIDQVLSNVIKNRFVSDKDKIKIVQRYTMLGLRFKFQNQKDILYTLGYGEVLESIVCFSMQYVPSASFPLLNYYLTFRRTSHFFCPNFWRDLSKMEDRVVLKMARTFCIDPALKVRCIQNPKNGGTIQDVISNYANYGCPSLLELSRNRVRELLTGDETNFPTLRQRVHQLEIPKVLKDVLMLHRPIYFIPEKNS